MKDKKNHHTRYALIALSTVLLFILFMNINYNTEGIETTETNSEIKKFTKKERIMRRDLQEIEMTTDPALGYVPYERMGYAKKILQKSLKSDSRGPIAGINFENYGPTNQGGRVRAIMFDPNDATNKRVFAGAVSGGLWKNDDITNAASSWTKINDFLGNLTIACMAADPNNPMIFYAATGEAYSGVTPGNGVYKSTDGGTTWSVLASTTASFKYGTDMVVRNESGTSVVYLGQKEKPLPTAIQTGGSTTYLGQSGLYRSADGGSTWTQVIPNSDGGQPGTVDEVDIDANGNLWASTGRNAYGQPGGDIYTCSTGCGTSTNWTKKYDASANSFNTVRRVNFDIAPSNANIIYAVGANENGSTDVEYFIKSTDGGTSWSNVTIPKNYDLGTCMPNPAEHFTRGQATYDLCLTIHPTNPNLVLLGGIDLYRTTDGFATSTHIGSWYAAAAPCDKYIHADNHNAVFRPGAPNEAIFANDGGVAYSADAGNSAVSAPSFSENTKDMVTGQLYGIDIGPAAGTNEFLAGLQDNGSKDWDHATGTVTPEVTGGDGAHSHIDQTDANIQMTAYTYSSLYVTNNEWTNYTSIAGDGKGRFINPSDYDDTNNILYGASDADNLFKLTGVGTTNTFAGQIAVGGSALGGKQATTIRVDRNTQSTIYVGNDDGKVYKIENANGGTLTSTDISTGLPAGTWISSIDVELGNSNHMLVTLSNFGVASVWESTNGGAAWTNIEGNLPDMPVRWGVFSPDNNDHVILATELGIWSTDNINSASTDWAATNTGFANVRTDMIKCRTSDKTLAIATHGRGMYKYTFAGTSKTLNISGLRLQGAMPSSGTTMTTLINALIPNTDPYGAGVTASSIPANAVDWVKIELRSGASAETATTVVATTAGFLLSDGTVKNKDAGNITFNAVADGNYYVSITHRNHLRIITNSTIALSTTPTNLDLSTAALYTNAAITSNTPTTTVNGVKALWGGDANSNHKVTYNGGSNDREAVLLQLGFNTLAEDLTYQSEDVNMNAKATYNGGTNDRESILQILGFNSLTERNAHHPN